MANILHQVAITATLEEVYEAITEANGLQNWWSQHSEIEASEGTLASISFYNNAVTFKLRVSELMPDKVVWVVEGGPPDWADTVITWTLATRDGQTVVNFAHRGFVSTDGNFASINYNWGWYLTSLKLYLEQGEGMPHTDADLM
jgi:uncharacterized protein YndB with AHSA1/START domain